MIMQLKNAVYFITILFTLVACKKQVAGPKGENGIDGKNGNANQTYIKEFTLLSNEWKTNTVEFDWNATIVTELVTDAVIEKGLVSVYVNVNSQWMPLPYLREDFNLRYKLSKGKIGLNYFKLHGVADQPGAMNFKVTIVSPK